MTTRPLLLILAVSLCACKDAKGRDTAASSGSGSGSAAAVPADARQIEPIETTYDKMQAYRDDLAEEQAKKNPKKKDLTKGDGQDEEWVPAEFKAGAARWKDVGVYVDGKILGFMTWGELPIALKPTWIKDKVSAEKRPGTDDPGWRWAKQRHYRFDEYFTALGIDLKQVKQVHVYGPKLSEVHISSGKELRSPAAKDFLFRFGGNTQGKPIPQVPNTYGNYSVGDKISGVMVYIKKKPPTLKYNEGPMLDGILQEGVPYYGEPIRGGIRVYLDDRLAAIIKRQELDVKKATKDADGELHWKLQDVLAAQGVDLGKVVEGWAIRSEMREEKFPGADLAKMTFTATSQAKGGILIDNKIRANVLALHTRNIQKDEIPVVTEDDE